MKPSKLQREVLEDFFERIKTEFKGLSKGSYDKKKLEGYKDLIWDIKIILKDDYSIDVDIHEI